MTKIENVLTAEQKQKLEENRKEIREQMRAKMREHRGGDATKPGDNKGPHAKGPGMHDRALLGGMLHGLNLTDKQEQQIKAAADDFREKQQAWSKEHGEQLKNLHEQMGDARKANDKEKMKDLRTQTQQLMQSRPDRKELTDKVESILTDEQKQQLQERREQQHEQAEHGKHGKRGDHEAKKDGDRPAKHHKEGKEKNKDKDAD